MKVRTRVAVVVILVVAGVVAVASIASRDTEISRQSYRTSVEVTATCGLTRIEVADRAWEPEAIAPATWAGVVDGTLWISGTDAVFIADDGTSVRYTLLDAGEQPTQSCATN